MAAVMNQDTLDISCVVIPAGNTTLLLPNVCVAEILPWRRIKPLADQPEWCLGLLGWRGESVPVVSFDRFNGDSNGAERGRCLVVMNRARRAESRAFYALVAQGLPRILQLADDDVANQSGDLRGGEAIRAKVGTEAVIVPKLSVLEDAVTALKF